MYNKVVQAWAYILKQRRHFSWAGRKKGEPSRFSFQFNDYNFEHLSVYLQEAS